MQSIDNFRHIILNIKANSKLYGIDAMGFTAAMPSERLAFFYAQTNHCRLEKSDLHQAYFQTGTLKSYPWIKSFIVGLVQCKVGKVNNENSSIHISNTGYISNMACEEDYHTYMIQRFNRIIQDLEIAYPEYSYKAFTDSVYVNDKALAVEAGLGAIGKHSLLINEQLGSRVFIGYIGTSIPFELFPEKEEGKVSLICSACLKCVENCPTKALNGDTTLNVHQCISHLTQKKENLTEHEIKALNHQLFGCDICQNVCPYNDLKEIQVHTQKEIIKNNIDLEALLKMDNLEFNSTFKRTASGYLGLNHLKRNAAYILANHMESLSIKQMDALLNLQKSEKVITLLKTIRSKMIQ